MAPPSISSGFIDLCSDEDESVRPIESRKAPPVPRPPQDRRLDNKSSNSQRPSIDLTRSPQRSHSGQRFEPTTSSSTVTAPSERGQKRPTDQRPVGTSPSKKLKLHEASITAGLQSRASGGMFAKQPSQVINLDDADDPAAGRPANVANAVIARQGPSQQKHTRTVSSDTGESSQASHRLLKGHRYKDLHGANTTRPALPEQGSSAATARTGQMRIPVSQLDGEKREASNNQIGQILPKFLDTATTGKVATTATQRAQSTTQATVAMKFIGESQGMTTTAKQKAQVPTGRKVMGSPPKIKEVTTMIRKTQAPVDKRASVPEDRERGPIVPESPPMLPTSPHEEQWTPVRERGTIAKAPEPRAPKQRSPSKGRAKTPTRAMETYAAASDSELGPERPETTQRTLVRDLTQKARPAAFETHTQENKTQSPARPTALSKHVHSKPDVEAAEPPDGRVVPSAHPKAGNSKEGNVERIVGQLIEEMRSDNEYMTRIQLQRARSRPGPGYRTEFKAPTTVFQQLTPIALKITSNKNATRAGARAKFTVETMSGSRNATKTMYSVDCKVYRTHTKDVPEYSHYVGLKTNVLTSNERVLHVMPYFHDEFEDDDAEGLKDLYYIDAGNRERKLLRLGQAEEFMEYADDMLNRIGCQWADVARFLLDSEPFTAKLKDRAAVRALQDRDKHMEDLVPDSERWISVLSKLPSPNPERLIRAALLCEQFQKTAKFPLWHVVRRSSFVRKLLEPLEPQCTSVSQELDRFTCRVCMRVGCSFHGEIREVEEEDEEHHDVETDIVNPPAANIRHRITIETAVPTHALPVRDRKNLDYWTKGAMANLRVRPDERDAFRPCYHPGLLCDQAKCSCFTSRTICEKLCGCPPDCARKFQGCLCSSDKMKKGQKLLCFEGDRCACFQLGRECDPDLCGDCGVCDVLDPIHHGDDRILQGRCNAASIQRGIPKHTLLGDSGIHGLGLYACEDMQKHNFLGEYNGEIVTHHEAERRGAVYHHQKLSYIFMINEEQDIDGAAFGNKTRYINCAQGKQANLYARTLMVNCAHRIGLFADRTIKAGEELFFDYGSNFPLSEQVGGKVATTTAAGKKAVPKTRNSLLVNTFVAVDRKRDSIGNLRAMPREAGAASEDDHDADADDDEEEEEEEGDEDAMPEPTGGGGADDFENASQDVGSNTLEFDGPTYIHSDDEDFEPEQQEVKDSEEETDEDSPEEERSRRRARRRRLVA